MEEMEEEGPGEIWFGLWVWPFLVICLNGFPSLWAGDTVAGSEELLASPPVQDWALNMSRLWLNGHCGKDHNTPVCVSETRTTKQQQQKQTSKKTKQQQQQKRNKNKPRPEAMPGQGRDPFTVAFPCAR